MGTEDHKLTAEQLSTLKRIVRDIVNSCMEAQEILNRPPGLPEASRASHQSGG